MQRFGAHVLDPTLRIKTLCFGLIQSFGVLLEMERQVCKLQWVIEQMDCGRVGWIQDVRRGRNAS